MSSNQQISLTLFRSQLQLRRFDEGTLGILDSILVSKDVKSLLQLRNGLKRLLRSESVSYLQEISHKSIHDKLLILDFFVRAFALVADVEGCENALLCFQANNDVKSKSNIYLTDSQVIDEIRKVKDVAVKLIAPHSVQAQTAEHLKTKSVQQSKLNSSFSEDTQCLASSMFREGIKKRNMQKLRELQSLQ
ncbi:hypothetical protein AQUCO_00400436v1 [Aquilegia coerulea]|uniref:Uncharacterized protein n=1 Tax=Aquilegia coerulea TaxID=218851 RepID=A0A2G5EUX6_AQUCA|nr:hypothetical protein AQUCO_00400436v1 [Aquilegia coerulea]